MGWQARLGVARRVKVSHGTARQAGLGQLWKVGSQNGKERQARWGTERRGGARRGEAWNGRQGGVCHGFARKGSGWQVWPVQDGCGGERNGMAGEIRLGRSGRRKVRLVRFRQVWNGLTMRGEPLLGVDSFGRIGTERCCLSGRGVDGRGLKRQA